MSLILPIVWDDKVNSPELLAFLQQYGPELYVTAEEINLVRDAINELHLAWDLFIAKSEKGFSSVGGNGDLVFPHELGLTSVNSNIMLTSGIGVFKGFVLYPGAKNYPGKIYTITNKQTNDVVLLHEDAAASVGFTFSNAQDYTCKPNEVVTFRFNDGNKIEMVASSMPASDPASWDTLTGKPTTFAPSTHSHAISEVTGLATELGTKEDKTQKGVAGGYAPLDTFTKIASQYLTIVNDLVTGGATALLSAEQGKQLKTQIDAINFLLSSDNINLDNVQEIVDAIEGLQAFAGENIANKDLSNVSARTFTQANEFTWNTAGFKHYLKNLIDKTGNTAYSKVAVIHPTTGETVTKDFADPANTTLAIQNSSSAQKTLMRTALLGTSTPASPVLNDTSVRFVTRGSVYVDLYGINLTLLDPTQIWIEKLDGFKIYAINYYNLTGTAVMTFWNLPSDLPNGDYYIKIQNGVAEQGLSNAYITVVDSISTLNLLNSDWKRKLRLKTDGTEGVFSSSGAASFNITADNYVSIFTSSGYITGLDSINAATFVSIIFKSENIFLGSKDWDIEIRMVMGLGNQAARVFYPYIGFTETTHAAFNTTQDIIYNHYMVEGCNTMKLVEAASAITFPNSTDLYSLYISKVGNKLFYRLYNRVTYTTMTFRKETINISKNYALFFRNTDDGGYNFQKTNYITARIMN